jgi:lipoyl(octanoyl) transferase
MVDNHFSETRIWGGGWWRFLDDGIHSGKYNMRYDENLAVRLLSGEGFPTLRVYGWNPSAISLGYHQSSEGINADLCSAEGIDIVRRPTGGRAIYHADEVTYSIAMYANGRSTLEIYSAISEALATGLRTMGVEVEYARGDSSFLNVRGSQTSIPCFASSARYEIQYKGKKLVGSAQRRYVTAKDEEVVLQHGSILLGSAHKRLSSFLRISNETERASIADTMEQKTTDLATVLSRSIGREEVIAAIRTGFENCWNIRFMEEDEDLQAKSPAISTAG